MCAYVQTCIQPQVMCNSVCMWRPEIPLERYCLWDIQFIFWETSLSLGSGAGWICYSGWPQSPRNLLVPFPHQCDYYHVPPCPEFYTWVLRLHSGPPACNCELFINWNAFLALSHVSLKTAPEISTCKTQCWQSYLLFSVWDFTF